MIRLSVCAGALGAASMAIASASGGGQQAAKPGSPIQFRAEQIASRLRDRLRRDDRRRQRRWPHRRRRDQRDGPRLVRGPELAEARDPDRGDAARQRLPGAARHRSRRTARRGARRQLAAHEHVERRDAALGEAGRSWGGVDAAFHRRGTDAPPDSVGGRRRRRQSRARRGAAARAGNEGAGLARPGSSDPHLHAARQPGARSLAGRGRRRHAPHRPQLPAREHGRHQSGRDSDGEPRGRDPAASCDENDHQGRLAHQDRLDRLVGPHADWRGRPWRDQARTRRAAGG